ncbi:MAG: hypothetical protein JWM59_1326 [Verrucomicrobiales bacterium]|nr:hypothetical protein [Verrucomicrobiales bacterium]
MKKITALFCLAGSLFLNLSCEQQTWEQTKMFNQNAKEVHHGGGHGESHKAEHGSAYGSGGPQAGSPEAKH